MHKVKSDHTCSYLIFTYTGCYCPFLGKCGDAAHLWIRAVQEGLRTPPSEGVRASLCLGGKESPTTPGVSPLYVAE